MAQGDAREGKWMGNWRMKWVACILHTTSEHGVSSINTADSHTSAASSRLNWLPCRFKWTRPFRRKKKSGFCACAITFQLASTTVCVLNPRRRPTFLANSVTQTVVTRQRRSRYCLRTKSRPLFSTTFLTQNICACFITFRPSHPWPHYPGHKNRLKHSGHFMCHLLEH